MTENPGYPAGTGGQQPEHGVPPVPPAPTGPSYDSPPAPGYQPPPAGGYAPPPVAPGYQPPPPAQGFDQPPPAGGYAPPPAAPGYQPPPASGYQPPPAQGFDQPPAAGGMAGVGQQFQNFDPKSLQNFDPKTVNPLDWGIIGAGLVAFIFSTFGFYKYTVSATGISVSKSFSAWHGFFGWFAVLISLLAAIALALQLIAKITLPVPIRTVVLGAFALATLCMLLALFVIPSPDGAGSIAGLGIKLDKGHGFGYWITFLAILAGTGLSFKRFTDSGGKLPSRS